MKAADPWQGVNERQQTYLKIIYEIDQEEERAEKLHAARTMRSRPADEWRWIKYGYDKYGFPLPLLGSLMDRDLVDPGTGSTFQALASRQLIWLRHEPCGNGEKIPYVRMTPKGRRLVRTATQEDRPKKLPAGTLREWHWQALSKAYRAYQEGQEGVFSKDHPFGGSGEYGGLYWNTWLRLRYYKKDGQYLELVKEHQNTDAESWIGWYYVIQITPAGREFYEREWGRYRELYPETDAPEPIRGNDNDAEQTV